MNRFGGLLNFLPSATSSVANPFTPFSMSPRASVVAQPVLHEPATMSRTAIASYSVSFKETLLDWKQSFIRGEIEQDDR